MGYIINEIKTVDTVNDGNVLVVKVYPIRSNSADNFGTNIAFAFPYSEQLFTQLSQISNNHKIWEPNEEDFVEDIIEVKNGDVMEVYKSIDLIPEVSIDDVIPLDPFFIDDDEDDEDEYDDEYDEDLFELDEPDVSEESIELINSDSAEPDPDDIFNDFYSDNNDSAISSKRYTEDEIKSMSVYERHDECTKCSKAQNLGGLIDFYTFFFYHGCQATNEYVIPGLAYLYGRAKDVDTLNKVLEKYSFCLWEMSQDSKAVTQKLLEIGLMYPLLTGEQISYLEHLYNSPKYCEMMDDILFDKEKLPRKITGITKEDLEKTNDSFPIRLIKETYNCFILNQRAQNKRDDEYTEYYVYVRRNNNIIKKAYGQVGSGECVLSGTLDMKSFIEYIEPKYGNDCADFFLEKTLERKPWYNKKEDLCRSYYEWVDWDLLTERAKEYFEDDQSQIDNIKMDIALLYLKMLNKKER